MLQTIKKVGLRWLLRFRKLDMSLKDQRQALVDTFINSIYLYDDDVGRCIALQSVPFFAAAPCLAAAADSSHVPLGFILPGCAPLHTCRKFPPVKLPKIRPEKFT